MTTQRPYQGFQGYQGYGFENRPSEVTELATLSPDDTPNEQPSKSLHRAYQGYPYLNPTVIDVPTISADAAAKWNNLPRRPLDLKWNRENPEAKKESDPVVVYIDLPEDGSSSVTERLDSSESHDFEMVESPTSGPSTATKQEPDTPVVYIDMPVPEASGSEVALTPVTPDEPTFVQDTIYFDQFDNIRIDSLKDGEEDSDDEPKISRPARRPNVLDLSGATGAGPSTAYPLNVPALMSKQTDLYGSPAFDTIPASQFPEPPPAYEEVQTPVVKQPRPVPSSPVKPERPPRTRVILPGDFQSYPTDQPPVCPITPIGMPNPGRKYLTCQHCNTRVHTLVIRESGWITHGLAFSVLLVCLWPVLIFIYCTDYFKLKNHYCPNCNQLIGHQRPLCGSTIHYTGHLA